jgi:hypothetical protein
MPRSRATLNRGLSLEFLLIIDCQCSAIGVLAVKIAYSNDFLATHSTLFQFRYGSKVLDLDIAKRRSAMRHSWQVIVAEVGKEAALVHRPFRGGVRIWRRASFPDQKVSRRSVR